MVKSNADRQREYRNRQRNVTDECNVTERNAVTEYPTEVEARASADQYHPVTVGDHVAEAAARRTNPSSLNWGEWRNMDEIQAHNRLPHNKHKPIRCNRVPIPGDYDYVGVACT